jgi:transposase
VINSIRAHLAEIGIVARVGRQGVEDLLDVVAEPQAIERAAVTQAVEDPTYRNGCI